MFKTPDIRPQRHFKAFLEGLSHLLIATQALSQSGRRAKPAPTDTQPPSTEDTAPADLGTRDLPEPVTLIVARQFTTRRMISENTIFANFVNRLNEFKNVKATTLGESNRDRARKRAKQ